MGLGERGLERNGKKKSRLNRWSYKVEVDRLLGAGEQPVGTEEVWEESLESGNQLCWYDILSSRWRKLSQYITILAVFVFKSLGVLYSYTFCEHLWHTQLWVLAFEESRCEGESAAGRGLQSRQCLLQIPHAAAGELEARLLHVCSPSALPTSSYPWKDWEQSQISLIWLLKDWLIPADILMTKELFVVHDSVHGVRSISRSFHVNHHRCCHLVKCVPVMGPYHDSFNHIMVEFLGLWKCFRFS